MAMREGNGNDGFVINDVDECAGIHLRADYCAEHEFGIKGIKRTFGIDDEKIGIEKRRISQSSKVYMDEFTYKKSKCALLTNQTVYDESVHELGQGQWKDLKSYISDYRWIDLKHNELSEGVAGSWDGDTFLIVVQGAANIKLLKEVYDAFQKNDIAIFLGGGNGPFMNPGLSISIISQLPAEIIKNMHHADMQTIYLNQAVSKTGIKDKLEKAGLKYYALSPEWNDPEDPKDGVKFWLNPRDQANNNHGWFSVEDLELWIDGKGPIPK